MTRTWPVYLSLTTRATLCRHTGRPIIEEYNPIYCYWATRKFLTVDQCAVYLPGYVGNVKRSDDND